MDWTDIINVKYTNAEIMDDSFELSCNSFYTIQDVVNNICDKYDTKTLAGIYILVDLDKNFLKRFMAHISNGQRFTSKSNFTKYIEVNLEIPRNIELDVLTSEEYVDIQEILDVFTENIDSIKRIVALGFDVPPYKKMMSESNMSKGADSSAFKIGKGIVDGTLPDGYSLNRYLLDYDPSCKSFEIFFHLKESIGFPFFRKTSSVKIKRQTEKLYKWFEESYVELKPLIQIETYAKSLYLRKDYSNDIDGSFLRSIFELQQPSNQIPFIMHDGRVKTNKRLVKDLATLTLLSMEELILRDTHQSIIFIIMIDEMSFYSLSISSTGIIDIEYSNNFDIFSINDVSKSKIKGTNLNRALAKQKLNELLKTIYKTSEFMKDFDLQRFSVLDAPILYETMRSMTLIIELRPISKIDFEGTTPLDYLKGRLEKVLNLFQSVRISDDKIQCEFTKVDGNVPFEIAINDDGEIALEIRSSHQADFINVTKAVCCVAYADNMPDDLIFQSHGGGIDDFLSVTNFDIFNPSKTDGKKTTKKADEKADDNKDTDDDKKKSPGKSDNKKKKDAAPFANLQLLRDADSKLFTAKFKPTNYTYARLCHTTKQPIVVSKKELDNIDNEFSDSYDGFLKVGSTKQKCSENFYICPRYWCPKSKVSISPSQMKSGIKCPEGEEVVTLYDQDFLKKPMYLKKAIHPDLPGIYAPCCSNDPKFKMQNDVANCDDKSSKSNEGKLLEIISLGKNLQKYFDKSMFNETNSETSLDNIMVNILFPEEPNTNLKDIVLKNYRMEDHVLNQSNIHKFFDPAQSPNSAFEQFKKDLTDNYKNFMNIKKIFSLSKELRADLQPNDYKLLREWFVYNSYKNYLAYWKSDIQKTVDDYMSLIKYDWFNPKRAFIFKIELKKNGASICSSDSMFFDKEQKKVCAGLIIDQNSQFQKAIISKDAILDLEVATDNEFNFNRSSLQAKLNEISKKYSIDKVVIDSSFKAVGVIFDGCCFLPFKKQLLIDEMISKGISLLYLDEVNEMRSKITPDLDFLKKVYKKNDVDFTFKEGHFILHDLAGFIYLQNQEENLIDLRLLTNRVMLEDKKVNSFEMNGRTLKKLNETLYYLNHPLCPMKRTDREKHLISTFELNEQEAKGLLQFGYKDFKRLLMKRSFIPDSDTITLLRSDLVKSKSMFKRLISQIKDTYVRLDFSTFLN